MIFENAYLIGVDPYCYRAGRLAKIVGLKMGTPENGVKKICLEIEFENSERDQVALSDVEKGFYAYVTLSDIINKEVPKVNR